MPRAAVVVRKPQVNIVGRLMTRTFGAIALCDSGGKRAVRWKWRRGSVMVGAWPDVRGRPEASLATDTQFPPVQRI